MSNSQDSVNEKQDPAIGGGISDATREQVEELRSRIGELRCELGQRCGLYVNVKHSESQPCSSCGRKVYHRYKGETCIDCYEDIHLFKRIPRFAQPGSGASQTSLATGEPD